MNPHCIRTNTLSRLEECFSILDLPYSASMADVKRSRRELAYVWHPDRFVGNAVLQERATRKLREINTAHDDLARYLKDEKQPWDEVQRRAEEERKAEERRKAEECHRNGSTNRDEELLRLRTELQVTRLEFDATIRRAEAARQEAVKRLEAEWKCKYQRTSLLAAIMSLLFLISTLAIFLVP